jgi:D-beta-D-heptose 7-phosphate kinase/D-beta-D-heptose 1-phosphate adenosyltransferase
MIVDFKDIGTISNEIRLQGRKIVFTNGCFDIIHSGHTEYLKQSRELGDILIVGLNSDDSVRRLKGEDRPLNKEEDRAEVLQSLKSVDIVVVFTEDTPFNLISEVMPDILVKGGDYKKQDIVGADIVEGHGGRVVVIPFVEGKSTTSLVEKIKRL